MTTWHILAIALGTGTGAALAILLALNLRRPHLCLWPAEPGWRRALMLWLFRGYCVSMIAAAGLSVAIHGLGAWPRYVIGAPIMLGAYALSLWAYKALGRENTYFGSDGLVTGGVYACSRNPGYVASLAAALGLAVVAGSLVALGFAAGLFAVYFLFALNEERSLSTWYGRAFRDYARSTPRFLDRRSLDRALAGVAGRN